MKKLHWYRIETPATIVSYAEAETKKEAREVAQVEAIELLDFLDRGDGASVCAELEKFTVIDETQDT